MCLCNIDLQAIKVSVFILKLNTPPQLFLLNENKAQFSGNEDISQCIQLSWRAGTAYTKLLLDTEAQKLELSWSSDAGEIVLESIEEISKYFP